MALNDIIKTTSLKEKKLDPASLEQHITSNIDKYRALIAYWRVYPDKLIDYYLSLGNPYNFQFKAYQRLCKRGPLPCER